MKTYQVQQANKYQPLWFWLKVIIFNTNFVIKFINVELFDNIDSLPCRPCWWTI